MGLVGGLFFRECRHSLIHPLLFSFFCTIPTTHLSASPFFKRTNQKGLGSAEGLCVCVCVCVWRGRDGGLGMGGVSVLQDPFLWKHMAMIDGRRGARVKFDFPGVVLACAHLGASRNNSLNFRPCLVLLSSLTLLLPSSLLRFLLPPQPLPRKTSISLLFFSW